MNESPPSLPPQPPSGLSHGVGAFSSQDQEHLKMLSICYYVMAGLTTFGVLFSAMYVVMGGMMMAGSFPVVTGSRNDEQVHEMMGGMFLAIGLLSVFIVSIMAVLEFIVARKIVRRQARVLCLVVAALNCLSFPFGTVLGVFTFIVLLRPQVAASFDRHDGAG